MSNDRGMDDVVTYLTESMIMVDRLYTFIMEDGFKGSEPKHLAALEKAVIHLGENLDLAMMEVSMVENSQNALGELLENFTHEMKEGK